ncbi:uncharacterized protein EV422DRAFT_515673 [Fimicolochytrium jonesii]|uniref:uncharacterized protein n=1 Tax=Fimicolochytrium jonesii TaxID=1396493 RepID=UPI0022FEAD8B|nr:uncharacterized protein EV422DRAFT_515673 [Fimicolochytrium jonesii]KAI8826186.1 hypothetical protein EV422DRAFT_515673 [Fimicolochytrium jonesii]
MTYNGTGDGAPAAADPSAILNAAVERAKAIAARLSQVKPPAGDQFENASSPTTSGTKRSHAEFDDYRPPSSGYRREDFQSESKRQASDHDQYGGGSRSFGSNPYDRPNDSYGGSSGGGGGRPRIGLGHSDAPPSSHYGPGASHGRSSVSEEITVPNQFVGLIIGRSGDNLKRIESTCNVKVQVASDKTDGPDADRRTTITGEPEDVARAKAMIMEQVNQGNAPPFRAPMSSAPPANPSDSITVPAHKVGLVIGRGGETIHRLQDQSGASINVVQESAQDTSSGLRTITLSGNPASVDMAKQLIDELVNSQGPPGRFQNNFRGETEIIKVHTDRVGLVIGRGGETIKSIQMQCDVKIKVDSQSDPEGNRTVTISGPPENIARAKEMVMERAYSSRREGGPMGGPMGGHGGGGGYQQQQQQYPQHVQQQAYGQYAPPGNYGGYGHEQWAGGAEGAPGAYGGYDANAYGWNAAGYGQQPGGEAGGAPPGAGPDSANPQGDAGGEGGQPQQQYDQEAWAAYYAQYQQYYGMYPQYAAGAVPDASAVPGAPPAPAPDATTEDKPPTDDQNSSAAPSAPAQPNASSSPGSVTGKDDSTAAAASPPAAESGTASPAPPSE